MRHTPMVRLYLLYIQAPKWGHSHSLDGFTDAGTAASAINDDAGGGVVDRRRPASEATEYTGWSDESESGSQEECK